MNAALHHGRGGVIVLDRDGTLVTDRGYLSDPDGLTFEPFAVDGLRWFQAHGYRLVVVTNQSGVGRGLFPLQRVLEMNERLHRMARQSGITLDAIYFCPHAPEAACACRKPALGLMTQAAAEVGFDPRHAVVIGDKASDIEFGRRAGAATILIAPEGNDAASSGADFGATNLIEAARAVAALHGVRD